MKNIKSIISPYANVFDKINSNNLETQFIFGENIEVLKTKNNWTYCKSINDKYFGWVKTKKIGDYFKPNYYVSNTLTYAYKNPDLKSPIIFKYYMNSKVNVIDECDKWFVINFNMNKFGYIPKNHLQKIKFFDHDWVNKSLKFENTPYVWGGKTIEGIDCSGLTQLVLENSILNMPRNSSDQLKFNTNKFINTKLVERGCLLFWKGHVAISISKTKVIHSNAHHMKVTIEKLNDVKRRIEKTEGRLIGIKKIKICS